LNFTQLLIGLAAAACISLAAFRLRALDASGAWAAFILGTVVFGLGGISWALVLMVFFVTSSGFSVLFKKRKADASEKFDKGSRRDAHQVLANGGLAGAAVIVHFLFPDSVLPWIAFSSAFAAANADTWATELGVLNRTPPRLVHTGKQVPAGTSGGVSLTGMLAAAAGSCLIALTALITWNWTGMEPGQSLLFSVIILISGFLGSMVDSLMGATIQGIFWCPQCQKETEKHPIHNCGTATELIRGKEWINNDRVNLFCTGSAVLISLIFSWVI
jgi:uncharacterized protein (TIGR00297 family)